MPSTPRVSMLNLLKENAVNELAGEEQATMTEIIFEVSEDEIDGGYSATALGYGIHTEGETLEDLRRNIKEAVECYFDAT